MILPISQNKIQKGSYLPQKNIGSSVNLVTFAKHSPKPSNHIGFFPPFLGTSGTYSSQIQALKKEMGAFPKDIDYRKNLMINAGKNPDEAYKLRPIIGLNEIKSIMKDFNDNEEFYSVGVDDNNLKNRTLRANLHIHTLASDGFLPIEELLNKAADYADKVAQNPEFKKEPFIIAITDHDTTESTKEAINIISENPLKYKNLRVILGAEFTTYSNIATDILGVPAEAHILTYGIDPNEETFSNFVENTKTAKHQLALKMIEKANRNYEENFNQQKNFFELEEAEDLYNPLKKNIVGIYNHVVSYIETKILLNEVVLKNSELTKRMKQNNLPLDSGELIKEIKNFYAPIDKNNMARNSYKAVSQILSQNLKMEESEIKELLQNTPTSKELKQFNQSIKKDLEEYKRTLTPKYDYMPTIKDIFDALKEQDGATVGIAHPLDYTKKIKDNRQKFHVLTEIYNSFKQAGGDKAGFSEVYYQSYNDEEKILKESEETKDFFNKLSEELNLFKTGSADSHRLNIFKRYY